MYSPITALINHTLFLKKNQSYIYFFPYFCFINNSIIRRKEIGNLDISTRNNKGRKLRYRPLDINLNILNDGRMKEIKKIIPRYSRPTNHLAKNINK